MSASEIWRNDTDKNQTVTEYKMLMSKLHEEEMKTQYLLEETHTLLGKGNRIKRNCKVQSYNTRPLDSTTAWFKDIRSKWSILHGFAVPHLQTLPEKFKRSQYSLRQYQILFGWLQFQSNHLQIKWKIL